MVGDDCQPDQDDGPHQISPQVEPGGQIGETQGVKHELIADGPSHAIEHRHRPDWPQGQKIADQFYAEQPERCQLFGNPILAFVNPHRQKHDNRDPEHGEYPGGPVDDEIQRGLGARQHRPHGDKDHKAADRKE